MCATACLPVRWMGACLSAATRWAWLNMEAKKFRKFISAGLGQYMLTAVPFAACRCCSFGD
jgi:hypothetical protein